MTNSSTDGRYAISYIERKIYDLVLGIEDKISGLAETKKIDSSYIEAYPGKKFIIEEIFGYEDRVMIRWVCHGKHKGKYKGIHPKNPEFAIKGLSIYRIVKGKISEVWQYWDRLGLLEQIGEVFLQTDPVEPGYYLGLLKSLGMEQYDVISCQNHPDLLLSQYHIDSKLRRVPPKINLTPIGEALLGE